jgi:hypothetical protein
MENSFRIERDSLGEVRVPDLLCMGLKQYARLT